MRKIFSKMHNDEEGQGLVEYALIVVLISVVCIIALTAIGSGANSAFTYISTLL